MLQNASDTLAMKCTCIAAPDRQTTSSPSPRITNLVLQSLAGQATGDGAETSAALVELAHLEGANQSSVSINASLASVPGVFLAGF